MDKEGGANDSRELAGGEIVYLVKDVGVKWQISSYECRQNVIGGGGGLVFEWLQGLPQDWRDREFDSVEDAVAFVQHRIKEGKVPRNSQPPV
jgi:hypothetical protein